MNDCTHCDLTPHPTKADEYLSHFLFHLKQRNECHCDICEFAVRLVRSAEFRKWQSEVPPIE